MYSNTRGTHTSLTTQGSGQRMLLHYFRSLVSECRWGRLLVNKIFTQQHKLVSFVVKLGYF